MSQLPESLLQDIAEDLLLPALSPALCRMLSPIVEVEVKKIIQQSNKFRKHGKSKRLTVDHINMALRMNRSEEIYGLSSKVVLRNNDSTNSCSSVTVEATTIDLMELARQPLPRCPLAPDVNLHWLAIDNIQPKIPENPIIIIAETDSQPTELPKEMQLFYSRTTGSILSQDKSTLPAVFKSFESDTGLQELLPFFSRFIYRQIKNKTRSIPLLTSLVTAAKSLLANPALVMSFFSN